MSAYLTACAAPSPEKFQTIMDSVTAEKVHQIIRSDVIPSSGENHGDVINRVSSAFFDVTVPVRKSNGRAQIR